FCEAATGESGLSARRAARDAARIAGLQVPKTRTDRRIFPTGASANQRDSGRTVSGRFLQRADEWRQFQRELRYRREGHGPCRDAALGQSVVGWLILLSNNGHLADQGPVL